MTLAKRLLLGTAAAFVATSGAHAADLGLPVAPSVDYVQICSIGSFTGFLLPGSDVCFDISGFARFEANLNGEDSDATTGILSGAVYEDGDTADITVPLLDPVTSRFAAPDSDDDDDFDLAAEVELNFDARTMTEWGLLRGFIRLAGDGGEEDFNLEVAKAFVQIGGLTAGVTDSFFDPVYTDYAVAPFGDITGTEDLALFGYAYSIGNGVTFMASLEDGESRNTGVLSYLDVNGGISDGDDYVDQDGNLVAVPASVGFDSTTGAYTFDQGSGGALLAGIAGDDDGYDESATMPDFVAAIRVDQAWGSAKLSAALHEVDPFLADVDSEFGYAAGLSAEINLPVGYGSTFGVFGNYAYGAVEYVGFDTEVGGTALPFFDALHDASTNDLDLTTAWGLGAGVDIGLTQTVSWQLEGYYTYVDHADVTQTLINEGADDSGYDAADDTISSSDIDYDGSIFAIRSSVTYEPFSGLTLAAGVAYQASDFDSEVTGGGDDDQFGARFRITRSF